MSRNNNNKNNNNNSLVLLIGGAGHIGYKVRVAVRSEANSNLILTNPVSQSHNFPSDALSFIIVPDLAVDGAYDDAINGVDFEEHKIFITAPAVEGTVGMLTSAAKESKIRRVVIASSVSSMKIRERNMMRVPYRSESQAYAASKVKFLLETEKWIKEQNPNFDVVNIHPSYVMGRDDLVQESSKAFTGTNRNLLWIAVGQKAKLPLPGSTVHNDDVSRLHGSYNAVSSDPKGSLNGTRWESVVEHINATRTEKTFEWKFHGWESQVESVVGCYIELLEKEKTGSIFASLNNLKFR
ncbi:hypothetical protein EJ08DRAFT_668625 [Tothia fuscella]|uniref:NAD(P)-binding domain-containing protein n=1 Tax=Tothia fuscella TaxID=1048955 RepID=A0A9P4NYL5_9PEZI|nr:hypothetical protein EJ08DRAFT_668625 [Tothia fuscella]